VLEDGVLLEGVVGGGAVAGGRLLQTPEDGLGDAHGDERGAAEEEQLVEPQAARGRRRGGEVSFGGRHYEKAKVKR
jgi:hypothetical protein